MLVIHVLFIIPILPSWSSEHHASGYGWSPLYQHATISAQGPHLMKYIRLNVNCVGMETKKASLKCTEVSCNYLLRLHLYCCGNANIAH